MLVVDSVRGIDGVGVAAVTAAGKLMIHKRAMFVHDYLHSKGFSTILRNVNRILIGHNRWATKGGVDNHTAHPFEFDSLVGAHNGTLRNQSLLPDSHKFAIDSENIFHSIDVEGVEETYKNINGAAALVYYDKKAKSLNFLRNEERPFFFTFSADRKTIFWASEDWMLYGLLAKHKVEHTAVVCTTVDHHYAIPFGNFKAGDHLPKMHIRKLKPFVRPVYITQTYNPVTKPVTKPVKAVVKAVSEAIDRVKKHYPIGSTVKFHYNRGKFSDTASHVDGHVHNDATLSVRLFVNSSHAKLNRELVDGIRYEFIGKVNGFDSEGNILVQSNSVSTVKKGAHLAIVNDKQKEIDTYIDFGGTLMNEVTFHALSSGAKECCWCTNPLEFKDGNVMIDRQTSVCSSCAEDVDVQLYLEQLGGAM